jgi:hypothetical protein
MPSVYIRSPFVPSTALEAPIFDELTGWTAPRVDPWICHVDDAGAEASGEGASAEAGGGEEVPEPTVSMTQAQYERAMHARVARATREYAAFGSAEELAQKLERLAELEKASGGEAKPKPKGDDRRLSVLEGRLEAIEKERDELKAARDEALERLTARTVGDELRGVLAELGVPEKALGLAVRTLREERKAALLEDPRSGSTYVTLQDGEHESEDLARVAKSWLKEHPYFAPGGAAGTGSQPSSGGASSVRGRPFFDGDSMPSADALAAALVPADPRSRRG